ncbi:MAG: alpha/beta fold hydrolase [Deltaproteobacteria bacterium]|nr:alpha/beta fold hydrolase [Deltaproteobacteria bacterium]
MQLILKLILYTLLFIIFLDAFTLYMNSHPPRYPIYVPPSKFNLRYEEVSFQSTDGVRLKGWFINGSGEGRLPTIIVCHGLGANRSDFTELSAGLSRDGYSVLIFDFRGHGESEKKASSFGYLEQNDLLGALRYVKTRNDVDKEKIGVYGFSMGGAVAILTAAETDEIKAVISDSSYTSLKEQGKRLFAGSPLPSFLFLKPLVWMYEVFFRIDADDISPVSRIGEISPRGVMIIGGGADEQMPSSDAMRLFSAAREPKEIWLIPGAVHGGTVYMAGDEYEKRVLRFLDSHFSTSHQIIRVLP